VNRWQESMRTLLAFVAGVGGTVAAFGAKYAFDFRLAKRRLELDERAAVATAMAGRPGQLRRSTIRLKDRIDALFRDAAQLPNWLAPAQSSAKDGYFLRSSVQRVFLFLSWSALLQHALDSLPTETLRARRDLQHQYALMDLGVSVLTNVSVFHTLPGYPTDRAELNLFTGTVDELADLGVAIYNQHAQVIPVAEFASAYEMPEPSLMVLREWISMMSGHDRRSAVIKARFACLGAVLQEIAEPVDRSFSDDAMLGQRLVALAAAANGYDFAAVLPAWMDAELAGAAARWRRP
jgi:hypothetical protein